MDSRLSETEWDIFSQDIRWIRVLRGLVSPVEEVDLLQPFHA